jgi:hypothetical protein
MVKVIIFTGGTMGSVDVEKCVSSLKAFDVKQKQWSHIRKLHARALLEAHDEVLRAYYGTLYDCQVHKVRGYTTSIM